MWEIFGAQCDGKLNRTIWDPEELLASSPIPIEFKTKDIIKRSVALQQEPTKKQHTPEVYCMAIQKILHFRQGSTGLVICYNSSATGPLLQLPFWLLLWDGPSGNSQPSWTRQVWTLETHPHIEEEIHQPKPSFRNVNHSILAIINITPLVL